MGYSAQGGKRTGGATAERVRAGTAVIREPRPDRPVPRVYPVMARHTAHPGASPRPTTANHARNDRLCYVQPKEKSHVRSNPRPFRPTALALFCMAAAILPASADNAEDRLETLTHCARDACLAVSDGLDSDGDHVSDDDERAAGSDPYDATSTPRLSNLLGLLAKDALPSFRDGRATVIVLPTADVNGMPILGGALAMPGRQNTLAGLGISPDRVAGMDLSNGLAIGRSSKPPSRGKPPMKIGGINMSLYAAGDGGTPPTSVVNQAINLSPNKHEAIDGMTKGVPTTHDGTTSGSSQVNYNNGNHDLVSWYTSDGKQQAKVDSYDATGKSIGGSTSTSATITSGDTKTTYEGYSWNDKTNGSSGGGSTTTNATSSPDGKSKLTDSVKTESKTGKSGSTSSTTSSANYYEDGKWVEGTSTTVTTTCKDGQCKTTTHTSGSSTECEASSNACNGTATAYVASDDTSYDPVTDLRGTGFSPAPGVGIALAVLGGNITYGETPLEEMPDEPPASSTPHGPLLVHVEDDPTWNGGVSIGLGDPRKLKIIEPRTDPNLPNPVEKGSLPMKTGNCQVDKTC